MKNRIISVVLLLALLLSLFPQGFALEARAAVPTLSQGQKNIVKRARQMVEIQWTPKNDIAGWRYEYTYKAGTTYKGLPYGQPVNASYVPWETSLEGFLAAVNDSGSKMYTSYSAYTARAPYYSVDCSGFVSWAWDLPSRCPSSSLAKYGTKISSSSYKNAQVGDCLLDPGVHAALITDLKYDSSGNIIAIEVSDAGSSSGCRTRWYGENNGYRTLDYFVKAYFKSGYSLYRSKTRDDATYTHSCAIPLEGDNCSKCGSGNGSDQPTSCSCSESKAGIYICTTSSTGLTIRAGHGTSYSKIGTIDAGAKVTVTAAGSEWAHVEYGGVSGYASMEYLEPVETETTPTTPTTPSCGCSEDYAGTYLCSTTSGTLTIRSGHDSSYAKLGSIPSGSKVTVTAGNGSWAHVEYNGISGYASMDYLILQEPAKPACDCTEDYAGIYICTTASSALSIRSGHGTSYEKLGTIPSGAKVTVTAANGSWAHVEWGGISGYASMEYLAPEEEEVDAVPDMVHWLSASQQGETVTSVKQGQSLYLNYLLYDIISEADLNEVSHLDYTAKLTVTGPNGATVKSGSFSSLDKGSISFTCTEAGTYSYSVSVSGDVTFSETGSFTAAQVLLATPAVTKVENTVNGVKLTWGKVAGAERYRIFSKNANGSWTYLGSTTDTSFTYTKAVSGSSYTFTVRCVDAANEKYTSSYNATGWTTTFIAAPKITKLERSANSINLTWGKVAGAQRYRVYVKTYGTSWSYIGTTTGNTFSYKAAKPGSTYIFTVRCADAANKNLTSSFHAAGWSIYCAANPQITKLENVSNGVKVTWGRVTGAERYRVYAKTVGGSWTYIGTTTGNSFIYTGAKSGTLYTFTVRCVNAANNTFTSYFNTAGWSTTFVAQPTVSKLTSTASGIRINWNFVDGAERYRVYVKNEQGAWTYIGSTVANAFTYTGAKAGQSYTFTVRCVNAANTAFTSYCNTVGWTTTYNP